MQKQLTLLALFIFTIIILNACSQKQPIKEDFSSPRATFNTLQMAIAEWDTNAIWHCMREGDVEAQNKHLYIQKLLNQRKTLQECFAVTEMSNILVDEHDFKAYMLRNCRNVHDSDIQFTVTGSGWKVFNLLSKIEQQYPNGNP